MTIDLNSILDQINNQEPKKLPPIHDWTPSRTAEIGIYIDQNGRWFHEGDEIKRATLVRLFASILLKEKDNYYLVTPAEKFRIKVEDVPFLLTSLVSPEGKKPFFVTNTEDVIFIDDNAVCELNLFGGQLLPYVKVRDELFARVSRNLYYQMLDQAEVVVEGSDTCCYFVSGDVKLLIGKLSS